MPKPALEHHDQELLKHMPSPHRDELKNRLMELNELILFLQSQIEILKRPSANCMKEEKNE